MPEAVTVSYPFEPDVPEQLAADQVPFQLAPPSVEYWHPADLTSRPAPVSRASIDAFGSFVHPDGEKFPHSEGGSDSG
jgi:hypothetical protein